MLKRGEEKNERDKKRGERERAERQIALTIDRKTVI